jgi:SagB-type dehydrogenase family enzyme
VELARLGALALTEGKLEEALVRHRAALQLFQTLREPEMEAAAWHQLGKVHRQQRQWDAAERHYREAARLTEECGHLTASVQTLNQLAECAQEAGRPESAEAWYRRALEVTRRIGNPTQRGQILCTLAAVLKNQPGRLAEAKSLAEEALHVAQRLDPAADTWKGYAVLADILDQQAHAMSAGDSRSALEAEARDYREVHRRAPMISAALARLDTPSLGRVVLLGQLGRSVHLGRRPDPAVACFREAIRVASLIPSSDDVHGLLGQLHADLGDALSATGQDAEARGSHAAALEIAERLDDLLGRARASQRLGPAVQASHPQLQPSDFELTLHEELISDFVFEPDLLIDGPRRQRSIRWTGEAAPLSVGVRPALPLGARTWLDDGGAVRFNLRDDEPTLERHPGCIVMRRIHRERALSGDPVVLWQLIAGMDGTRTVGDILSRLPADQRPLAARMIATLAATGTVDVSGRSVGRFLHAATKKGVLPGGGLDGDQVLNLATDGQYLAYRDAPRIAVNTAVPDRLRAFHTLTRARRSQREYSGLVMDRRDFDALLHTACGVTGSLAWSGREVKLRAYPSSGALYAVEIYPVVFSVEGLAPAVYHYRAVENVLELVRPAIDHANVAAAALPVERAMVSGAAVLFCLAGHFPRHERKYGGGGYRMLVAEAGHVSQNLILAATALGLNARPFGGVFDDLLNHDLGLDVNQAQFLLAVLVGPKAEGPVEDGEKRSGKRGKTSGHEATQSIDPR